MLEVSILGCIRGDRRLFSDLSFSAGAGELIELRGPNGSGKTSLLRILCGLSSPAAGQVRWNGKKIRSLAEEYFRDVAYFAHLNALKDEISSLEYLCYASGYTWNPLTKDQVTHELERY